MELDVHILPTYGHCHLISDSTFDRKHQSLKKNIIRRKNIDNLSWALDSDVCEQWKLDVSVGLMELEQTENNSVQRSEVLKNLRTLLLGTFYSDKENTLDAAILRIANEAIEKLITPKCSFEIQRILAKHGISQRFRTQYSILESQSRASLTCFRNSKYITEGMSGKIKTQLSENFFEENYEALLASEKVLGGGNRNTLGRGDIFSDQRVKQFAIVNRPYVFLFAIELSDNRTIAVCNETCVINHRESQGEATCGNSDFAIGSMFLIQTDQPKEAETLHLLNLEEFCRRIAIVHACNNERRLNNESRIVHFANSTLVKNRFYVQPKISGFPPFRR